MSRILRGRGLWFPLALLVALGQIWCGGARAEASCDSGAQVDREEYCRFFKTYLPGTEAQDKRIAEQLGVAADAAVRSIALIVAIDTYPNLSGANLPPAGRDLERLQDFLVNDQKFDEVIVLHNEEATKDAIRYFLTEYVDQQWALFQGHTRVLFAYSGHGANSRENPDLPAGLVLADAFSETDLGHRYPLDELNRELAGLGSRNYQVLALINACFGGDMFGSAQSGGNPFVSNAPGAHAITAGAANELVWALPGDHSGSIFFDSLIDGIRSGKADKTNHLVVSDRDGKSYIIPVPIIRLGNLVGYLTETIQDLGVNKATGKPYSPPWFGPVNENGHTSVGGFFFLAQSEQQVASASMRRSFPRSMVLAANGPSETRAFGAQFALPSGPSSSLTGHPEIKVFSPPEVYPIHGIDVSQFNVIDWPKLPKETIRFAYIRATGIKGVDKKFRENWSSAKANGIRRGAYHYTSFCQSPDEQFDRIVQTVKIRPGDMPIALDIEWPPNKALTREIACAQQMGVESASRLARQLLRMLHEHYGRIPVVYGNREVFTELLAERSDDYIIWLGDRDNPAIEVNLPGDEPWTFWQYTNAAPLPGIAGAIDQNVFFGNAQQFEEFLDGDGKIALKSSRR